MEIKLNENEKIEDLQLNGLKIIQNKNGFCFGIDSVLLSDFAKNIKENSKVVDLGTGTGIIATLLCAKTKLKEIIGIEIQKEVFEMATKSIKLNKLENKFKILNDDILNINKKILISRHETTATLKDFIKISQELLKDKGEFYIVNRPDRLVDILSIMRECKIEPKTIRFVYSNKNSEPKLILIKGIKNAKPFLKIEKNLYIYDEEGNYTQEINKIYNK